MAQSPTASLTRANVPAETPTHARPSLGKLIRHVALNLGTACVVPAVMFYVILTTVNVIMAVLVALAWTYAALLWRWVTGRGVSWLLVLTAMILTARTASVFVTGDTFLYFIQPVITDAVVAAGFLLSLATASPVVARIAADFYPMDREVARRPMVKLLFWRLTLLWGLVGLFKGGVTLWLLESLSLVDFVLVKNVIVISTTTLAVAATIWTSHRVARREGLIGVAPTRG